MKKLISFNNSRRAAGAPLHSRHALSAIAAMLVAAISLLTSCKDNDNSLGVIIQPQDDLIITAADTFIIESANYYVPAISAQADTMVFGQFYSPKYGPTKADLVVQIAPPVDYVFPESKYNPQPDSLILIMYYNTWFGSPYSPLEMSIYEVNKQTPQYSTQYMSDFDPGLFTDSTILMGSRLATTIDLSRSDSASEDTASTPYIRYRFSDEQLQRFWSIPADAYSSEDNFLDNFGGMYITSRYGSSTLIYFNQINLFLYYHYTYQRDGKDVVVNTSINYPANKEVRQLNRYYHNDIATIATPPDSVCYIKSAAGIYPKIQLPLGRIAQRISEKIGDRELNINAAEIDIEAIEYDTKDVYLDPPTYLLALTADEFDDFIRYNTPPTSIDTTQVIASYSVINNSYTFNLNYFLTKHLRRTDIAPDETLDLILVPVLIEGTTSSVTYIKPLTKLAATTIRGGRNEYSPMRLKLLYNGF